MDTARTERIASIEDQIWHLKVRAEAMRDALPSNAGGSQGRIDAEKDLATVRAEIRGLVRERRARP